MRRWGNPAARWQARQRGRAKTLGVPSAVDERDVGIRAGVAERLGVGDEPMTPEQSFRHSAWLWFQRDPETGLLPFGVW